MKWRRKQVAYLKQFFRNGFCNGWQIMGMKNWHFQKANTSCLMTKCYTIWVKMICYITSCNQAFLKNEKRLLKIQLTKSFCCNLITVEELLNQTNFPFFPFFTKQFIQNKLFKLPPSAQNAWYKYTSTIHSNNYT